jgi:hypothetical protein
VLLRDGDGVPGTHRAPGPLGADFHIAAPPESNTRVFKPDLLTQLLVKAGLTAYEDGEVVLYSLPRM